MCSQSNTPVNHGCRAPYTLIVDQDHMIICSACKSCWHLHGEIWLEVNRHRDETEEG